MSTETKKRHRLSNMCYDEISFVDVGANQDSHVLLIKRDFSQSGGTWSANRLRGMPGSAPKKQTKGQAPKKKGKGKKGSGGGTSERAQNWKEERHPRAAAGSPAGGEFATTSSDSKKKHGKGGTTKAKLERKNKGPLKPSKKKTPTKRNAGVHTIQEGQTLWGLAQKYYGDGRKWTLLARASGIKNPRKIPIGTKILLPGLGKSVAQKKKLKAKKKKEVKHKLAAKPKVTRTVVTSRGDVSTAFRSYVER